MDETTRKGLLKYWNYENNKKRGVEPEDIDTYKGVVSWNCDEGHVYIKKVESQIKYGIRCSKCNPIRLIDEPELLKYYDYEKNDEKPENIRLFSKNKYWWKDDEGNGWFISAMRMNENKHKILRKADKLIKNPKLAAEYNIEKNKEPIEKVVFGSKEKYWWKCKNGHEWYGGVTSVKDANSACKECKKERTRLRNEKLSKKEQEKRNAEIKELEEQGCYKIIIPIEQVIFTTIEEKEQKKEEIKFDDSLAYMYPVIATYWNYERNGDKTPMNVSGKLTSRSYWWKCEEGHEWVGQVASMIKAKTHVCKICGKQNYEYQI